MVLPAVCTERCTWGYLTPKTLPNPLLPLGPFPRRRLRSPSIRPVAESGMSAASMGQLHAQAIIPDRAAMLRAQKLPSRADVQLGTTFAAGRAHGRARPSCFPLTSPHPWAHPSSCTLGALLSQRRPSSKHNKSTQHMPLKQRVQVQVQTCTIAHHIVS